MVIDASVVVEYLIVSALTAPAQTLLRAAADGDVDLWAPDLIYAEAVSAFRRLCRLRALAPAEGNQAVADLLRLPITTTGSRDLMARAWVLRDAITPYDACYVVLAEVLGAPLVTADRRLVRGLPRTTARAIFLGALS